MVHRDAPLTETGRLRLARCVVEQGWPAGTADRSLRPVHSPRRTPQPVVRQVVHLCWKQRLGPVAIAGPVGLAPSTVHRILVSSGLPDHLVG